MAANKECAVFLGVFVAERALSRFFKHVKRMPHGNLGFDIICDLNYKIDVKSSCLVYSKTKNRSPRWAFHIKRNVVADFFLCLAFDNRENLTPQHVWLIPGELVNEKTGFGIADVPKSLAKWQLYEKPLDKVMCCCDKMKGKA